MRMSGEGESAADLIARVDVDELAKILRDYGDVKKAAILARAIKNAQPRTTMDLRNLIHNPRDVAPVFQAFRIAVNDEMGEVRRALAAVPDLLDAGGKCVCVTFHSLEDRIVKTIFKTNENPCTCPSNFPVCVCGNKPRGRLAVKKPIVPGEEELKENKRSKSSQLRVFERI